jgi:hypothetical protein
MKGENIIKCFIRLIFKEQGEFEVNIDEREELYKRIYEKLQSQSQNKT